MLYRPGTKTYILVCKLSLWLHRYFKLCKNISRHIDILWAKFSHDIIYSFWVILFLETALFSSVKCISVQKNWKSMFFLFLTHWEFQKCIILVSNKKFARTHFFERKAPYYSVHCVLSNENKKIVEIQLPS